MIKATALGLLVLAAGCEKIARFDEPIETGAQCADGIDNDTNGKTDCEDDGCAGTGLCGQAFCGNGRVDMPVFTFAAGVSVAVPGGPVALGAAHINADALTDIVVGTAGGVRELRGAGGPTLQAQPGIDTLTIGPVLGLAVARLDTGTSDDVALLLGGPNAPAVYPVLNSAGTLALGRPVSVGGATALVAGPFDRSAGDDVLVAASEPELLLNNSMGMFSGVFLQLPPIARTLATGDYDGDGDPDVAVVARATVSQAYLLTNIGPGTTATPFRTEATVTLGMNAGAIAFFNADEQGQLDAVVLEETASRGRVLLANGGMLTLGSTLGLGGTPVSLATGDFNLDGHDDVAIGLSGGTVALFTGNGAGAFEQKLSLSAAGADAIVAAEIDGTRGVDLVVAERAQNRVTVFLNTSRFEECDDGNQTSGDTCNEDCTLP